MFLPSDATLELHPGQAMARAPAGGVPPYRWAVNGVPLPPAALGSLAEWQPDGAGFTHLTLTDDAEHSEREDIRLQ